MEGQHVFFSMNVNASKFRQSLEAAMQAGKQNINDPEAQSLL